MGGVVGNLNTTSPKSWLKEFEDVKAQPVLFNLMAPNEGTEKALAQG